MCDTYRLEKSSMLVLIVLFFYVVSYHSRLVEVTSRLDFLWKQQAVKELGDISEMRQYNTQLLKNILPDHVANYFLQEDRKNDVSTPCSSVVPPNTLLPIYSTSIYILYHIPAMLGMLNHPISFHTHCYPLLPTAS